MYNVPSEEIFRENSHFGMESKLLPFSWLEILSPVVIMKMLICLWKIASDFQVPEIN